jgi:hypothetical protein
MKRSSDPSSDDQAPLTVNGQGAPVTLAHPGEIAAPWPVCDWLGSQTAVLGIWLDRLIAEGDPGDLISLIHRQQLWLEMMRERVARG